MGLDFYSLVNVCWWVNVCVCSWEDFYCKVVVWVLCGMFGFIVFLYFNKGDYEIIVDFICWKGYLLICEEVEVVVCVNLFVVL